MAKRCAAHVQICPAQNQPSLTLQERKRKKSEREGGTAVGGIIIVADFGPIWFPHSLSLSIRRLSEAAAASSSLRYITRSDSPVRTDALAIGGQRSGVGVLLYSSVRAKIPRRAVSAG